MATRLPVTDRLQRKLPRLAKFARRRLLNAAGTRVRPRPVFVLGAQRSGTRLPLHVLERNPDVIAYNEGSAPYFDGVMLRDDATVRRLLFRNPFPVVVLKPICESHRALHFLETFPGGKVVWIFRHYHDTVRSAARKWSGALDNLRPLARGDRRAAGWRAGGLTDDKLQLVRSIFSESLPPEGAHALMYYLRNSLYFDQRLHERAEVCLVSYEDLATQPGRVFPALFGFLGCRFDATYLNGVYGSSVRTGTAGVIPREIEALCEDVYRRLAEVYAARSGGGPGSDAPQAPDRSGVSRVRPGR